MSQKTHPSRRRIIRMMAAAGAIAPFAGSLPFRAAHAKDLVIGFIYVGPRDDFGYNQAHAEGAAAVKKLSGVTVIEEENVAETIAVEKTMGSMIELDGASLMFPTSFGYFDPHMLKTAAKYPEVQFRHAGGLWSADKHPKNTGSYFGYIDEGQYLNGIAAGHASKTGKIGFVAAKPIPQVLRNINAFTLGAKSVNPNIVTQLIVTGEWSMPVREAEATNTMIDQGVDVLTCHVDSPKVVVETAERRGVYVCGYHANQAPLAPKGYLTGAEWNWEKIYVDFANDMKAGKAPGNFVRGGLAAGFVKTSPFGPAVSDAARKQSEAVKAKMLAQDYVIFKGPMKTNTGKEIIPPGKDFAQTDGWLETMDWLVEGVQGSTS
jgi:simple sugar transport system substrate-binding protein